MKKPYLVCIIIVIFLCGMAKHTTITPFLQPIIQDLKTKTNVPVMLPTYWIDLSKTTSPFPNVQYDVDKKGYSLLFLAMERIYPPNDPSLNQHSQSNELGTLTGEKKNFKPLTRPKGYVKGPKVEGVQFLTDPKLKIPIYTQKNKWTIQIEGMGSKNASKEMASSFIRSLNEFDWLKSKDIKRANVYIVGEPTANRMIVSWESKKRFVYTFYFRGGVKETIKVLNSFIYVE